MDIPRKRYIPVTEIWRLIFQEALAFGKEWLSVFAPGHQAVIAAHPDGHHGSKNMHVHIVLNSVRKYAGNRSRGTISHVSGSRDVRIEVQEK